MKMLTTKTTQQIAITFSMEEASKRFIDYIDASPKTIATYTRAIRQFIYYLQDNGITQPTRQDVLAYRDNLKTYCKPSTVQNYIIALRQLFKWTASEGIYPNIADNIKGAKLDRNHKKDYLTAEQMHQVLQATKQDESATSLRNYAIIALITSGGLRTIEVARANIGDLSVLGGQSVLYIQGKGREEKTEYIKIVAPVERAIREYLKTRNTTDPKAPLFTSTSNNSTDQRLSTRTISGICKQGMKNAGYNSDRLTAHSLRHTAVTLALLGGETLQEVQQFARHANINTTQIYAHNLDRAQNRCENIIARAIF